MFIILDRTRQDLCRVRGLCLDIDDTLSTHGKLTADAFASLWELKEAGFWVVPVTGRPAGWCDHIARFWPVDAVIGENGAFAFTLQSGKRQRIETPGAPPLEQAREKLRKLADAVKKRFPQAQWASDQNYREYDLAIDFCEDVPAWKPEDVRKLADFCISEGAQAKVSSIHVNAWFGDYDKYSGFTHWLASRTDAPALHEWAYVGDSPNDEPLFEKFPLSFGVANVRRFLPSMRFKPKHITSLECGAGFRELAQALLDVRKSTPS